jgi:hypothetical protein
MAALTRSYASSESKAAIMDRGKALALVLALCQSKPTQTFWDTLAQASAQIICGQNASVYLRRASRINCLSLFWHSPRDVISHHGEMTTRPYKK